MKIEITPVQDARTLRAFVRFPFSLYRNNPYWVPPLVIDEIESLSDNNPSLGRDNFQLLIARKGNQIVGRVALMVNPKDVDTKKELRCRFSHFDVIDDREVSSALMAQAMRWAREKNLEFLEGPMGMTNMDKTGLLIEGFDQLSTISTNYNAPYYQDHLTSLGFQPHTLWREYRIRVPDAIPEKVKKFSSLIAKRHRVELVSLATRKDVLKYGRDILHLMNETHSILYGYTPLDEKHIDYYIGKYQNLLHPDYVSIVLDSSQKMIAFGIALPSMSKAFQKANGKLMPLGWWHIKRAINKNDTVDLQLIGVSPAYQRKGIPALILNEFTQSFYKNGIQWIESNLELESNKSVQALMEKYEHHVHKRRCTFVKYI